MDKIYIEKRDGRRILLASTGMNGSMTHHQLNMQVNDPGKMTIEIPVTNTRADDIDYILDEITFERNGKEVFRGRPDGRQYDFMNTRQISVTGMLAYLEDVWVPPYEYKGSITGYIDHILNAYNEHAPEERKIYIGEITVTDPNDYIVRSDSTYRKASDLVSEKLVGDLGGYAYVRMGGDNKRYFDYVYDLGQCGQTIEYGKNLIDLSRAFDCSSVYTVLIPVGAEITPDTEDEGGDYTGLIGKGLNLLYDTDEPTLTKNLGPANRYFSNSSTSTVVPSIIKKDNPAGCMYVAKYVCTKASVDQNRNICFYSGQGVKLEPGKEYIMSAWMRREPTGSAAFESLFQYGVTTYEKIPKEERQIITTEWTRYAWKFEAPSPGDLAYSDGSTRVYMGINVSTAGSATVYVTGYRLEAVEQGEEDQTYLVDITDVNGGVPYIYDEDAVARYGWRETYEQWEDVTEPQNLLRKAQARLQELVIPSASYTVKALDLANATGEDSFLPGKVIYVGSEVHRLGTELVATAVEYKALRPEEEIIEIGTVVPSYTQAYGGSAASFKTSVQQIKQDAAKANFVSAGKSTGTWAAEPPKSGDYKSGDVWYQSVVDGQGTPTGEVIMYIYTSTGWISYKAGPDSLQNVFTDPEVRRDIFANVAAGVTESVPIPANGTVTKTISFGKTFQTAPVVTACFASTGSGSSAGAFGSTSIEVLTDTITTTGCTIKCFNAGSSARQPSISWIAIGE